jgi:hypothetical protein
MEAEIQEGRQTAHHKTLVVRVRYITSRKQFVDPQAQQEESLAALKPRVLEFFELVEGSVDGGTKTYHYRKESTWVDISPTRPLMLFGLSAKATPSRTV